MPFAPQERGCCTLIPHPIPVELKSISPTLCALPLHPGSETPEEREWAPTAEDTTVYKSIGLKFAASTRCGVGVVSVDRLTLKNKRAAELANATGTELEAALPFTACVSTVPNSKYHNLPVARTRVHSLH